jgi:hypothetical protein
MGFRKQIAQARPGVTTAVTAWTVPYFGQYDIDLVHIVNTSSTLSVDVSVFHDPTGAVYDEDSSLVYNYTLGPGDIFQLGGEDRISDYQEAGTIGVQASIPNIANFKIYGVIEGENSEPI